VHVSLWEFEPRNGKEQEFEQAYGPNGEWVKLFARSPEYRGTELLRSADGRTYFTIDRWTSADAFAAFQREWQHGYEELDRRFEALTERETQVGGFDTV
jgi:heme-degrading monooxygenase HmoA